VELFGPGFLRKLGNEEFSSGPDDMVKFFLERKSVELADVAIAPTQHRLKKISSSGWSLPSKTFVEQFPSTRNEQFAFKGNEKKSNEIVFFGRLETRKGIVEFCDAIDILSKNLFEMEISVTFLGGHGAAQWMHSSDFISKRAERWSHKWKVIPDFNHDSALRYLSSRDALVVLPSRDDASGRSVIECIQAGVPLIVSDIPPFREIIERSTHKDVLFENTAKSLSLKIANALKKEMKRARAQKSPADVAANWAQWHSDVETVNRKSSAARSKQPLISICVTHRNRTDLLDQCLTSIDLQTYRNFEVILMDDASDTPKALRYLGTLRPKFKKKNWRIVFQKESLGPSANRNQAAKLAKGEYIIFMDDDNVAKPEEIATFVKAAQYSGMDILTCACDRLVGEKYPTVDAARRWIPMGDSRGINLMLNLYGDMNFFIKRKTFLELGGLKYQAKNTGAEDAEFLARAAFQGYKLAVVPDALFWYRYHGENLSSNLNQFESLLKRVGPYFDQIENQDMKQLMSLSLGVWFRFFQHEERPNDRIFPPSRNQIKRSIGVYQKRLFFADATADLGKYAELTFPHVNQEEWGLSVSGNGQIVLPEIDFTGIRRLYVELETICGGTGSVHVQVGPDSAHGYRTEVRTLFKGNNQTKFYIDLPLILNPLKISITLKERSVLEFTKLEVLGDS
jgi:glycosyltransferase involved in cell wall biosynthesis